MLLANGHESSIAFGRRGNPSKSKEIQVGDKLDFYQHGLLSLLLDKHGLGSKGATISLIKSIRTTVPDIIHLHNIHGYYLNYPVLFRGVRELGIPVVWTFHDAWAFTGHCSYFDSVNCLKWQTECNACPKKKAYPKSIFIDNSKSNFNLKKKTFTSHPKLNIVTPSNWLAENTRHSFLKSFPISVIHNGIDLEVFKVDQSITETEKKIVLGVASIWDERKGLKDFIKLSELLDDSYQIVLIGLNEHQLTEIPKKIKGISRTESLAELVKWYNKAHCFVNPTYQDNFPTTNIEALGCGTPVITYQTGGSPEAVDYKTGKIVQKGSVKGIASAIAEIGNADEVDYRIACRKRAEQLFDKKDRFKDYINLYEDILNES